MDSRKALGAFLKSVRAKTHPESAGFRAGARRRATGLRREEVALAAGISATWYTWIEQGRSVSCSAATLSRIADALRMTRTERAHLFDLAANDDQSSPRVSSSIPAELEAFARSLTAHPTYVVNRRWDVLYFNDACAAVLGPFDAASRTTSNVLRRLFLDEMWREGFENWGDTATSAVAQFRATTGALQRDDAFAAFVAQLADDSDDFRSRWEQRRLAPSPLTLKVFNHPTAGRIEMEYATFKPDAAADDVRLVLYVPRSSSMRAVQRLARAARR